MRTIQDEMAFYDYDFHININFKVPYAASAIAASCVNVKIGGSAPLLLLLLSGYLCSFWFHLTVLFFKI
jgi:hypothetical protein